MKQFITFGIIYIFLQTIGYCQDTKVIQLRYISPLELREELATQYLFDEHNMLSINGARLYCVFNNSTNQVMVNGDTTALSKAIELIKFLDTPPRQIIIEAKIVEINNEKLSDLGMDWHTLLDRVQLSGYPDVQRHYYKAIEEGIVTSDILQHSTTFRGSVGFSINLGEFLKLIKEKGIGHIVSVPKIVTTNNKKASILDGSRITYVTRYSSYADLYKTEEMSAGLMLTVTPSLGESGYIKLNVIAKLTRLGEIIADSPSESGQIIENTVIVRDGEEFLLGGFKTEEKIKTRRKVPILGTILPFLFSRTVETETTKNFLIVLKPTVIDLKPVKIPDLK